MKIEKRVHPGYEEYQLLDKQIKKLLKPIFGKWQYIITSEKGTISLISFVRFYEDAPWEIYCLEGNLFDDINRFKTKQEAMKVIKDLLK